MTAVNENEVKFGPKPFQSSWLESILIFRIFFVPARFYT